jgi:hypothetical protein
MHESEAAIGSAASIAPFSPWKESDGEMLRLSRFVLISERTDAGMGSVVWSQMGTVAVAASCG